jgi:hypothetical protein
MHIYPLLSWALADMGQYLASEQSPLPLQSTIATLLSDDFQVIPFTLVMTVY